MTVAPGLRIYLSGAISGGKGDLDVYRAIATRLRREGYDVTSGEVTEPLAGDPDDRAVYRRDLAWLDDISRSGGVLVAEVSTPSLGVGYEVSMARHHFGIPVICLWRPGPAARCSAMIAGDPGLILIRYDMAGFDAALQRLLDELREISTIAQTVRAP